MPAEKLFENEIVKNTKNGLASLLSPPSLTFSREKPLIEVLKSVGYNLELRFELLKCAYAIASTRRNGFKLSEASRLIGYNATALGKRFKRVKQKMDRKAWKISGEEFCNVVESIVGRITIRELARLLSEDLEIPEKDARRYLGFLIETGKISAEKNFSGRLSFSLSQVYGIRCLVVARVPHEKKPNKFWDSCENRGNTVLDLLEKMEAEGKQLDTRTLKKSFPRLYEYYIENRKSLKRTGSILEFAIGEAKSITPEERIGYLIEKTASKFAKPKKAAKVLRAGLEKTAKKGEPEYDDEVKYYLGVAAPRLADLLIKYFGETASDALEVLVELKKLGSVKYGTWKENRWEKIVKEVTSYFNNREANIAHAVESENMLVRTVKMSLETVARGLPKGATRSEIEEMANKMDAGDRTNRKEMLEGFVGKLRDIIAQNEKTIDELTTSAGTESRRKEISNKNVIIKNVIKELRELIETISVGLEIARETTNIAISEFKEDMRYRLK